MRSPARLFAVVLLVILLPTQVLACSPGPWEFSAMQTDALALVRVKIRSVSDDGREAKASVLDYVGPDRLPETIDLPRTVNSTFGAGIQPSPCPDFSLRWQPEAEYLVLLREVAPALVLLDASGKTAFEIANDGRVQTTSMGTRSPANAVLAQFAAAHHYPRKSESRLWLFALAGAMALGAIVATAWLAQCHPTRG